MSKVLELQQRKGELIAQERGVLDSVVEKKMTAEQATQLEAIAGDVRGIDVQIEAEKRQEAARAAEADAAHKADEVKERSLNGKDMEALKNKVLDMYIRGRSVKSLTEQEQAIYKEAMERGQEKKTDSKGGFLTTETFSDQVIKTMEAYGGMLACANVINTETGNTMNMPTFDDSGNRARIIGEAVKAGEEEIAFGRKALGAFKYVSGVFPVTNELITDANVDVIAILKEAIAERFQRAWNEDATLGTGIGEPEGIVTGMIAANATIDTANNAFVGDNLIDLVHAVNAAYRYNAKFMMNDATLANVRKLKDGQGNYLWSMGDVSKGVVDKLLGYPVEINYHMDDVAANKVSIIFGDIKKAYTARRVGNFVIRRSDDFKFDSDEVSFVSFNRFDGKLLQPNAVKGLKHGV